MYIPLYKSKADDVILGLIREGMKVLDDRGKLIGLVSYVRAGDEDYAEPSTEIFPVTDETQHYPYDDDELPDELESRLLHHGYIRIDGGLFTSDRFAMPHQIEAVIGDQVELNVADEELFSL
ncbi:MAG: hypothetical protein U0694_28175 [Anaerolineae bacterium]